MVLLEEMDLVGQLDQLGTRLVHYFRFSVFVR